jgi:hypothetical protein
MEDCGATCGRLGRATLTISLVQEIGEATRGQANRHWLLVKCATLRTLSQDRLPKETILITQ